MEHLDHKFHTPNHILLHLHVHGLYHNDTSRLLAQPFSLTPAPKKEALSVLAFHRRYKPSTNHVRFPLSERDLPAGRTPQVKRHNPHWLRAFPLKISWIQQ